MPGPFLPVITTITTPPGTVLRPANELRIGAGLTATYVANTGNGEPYILIALTVAPSLDTVPIPPSAQQAPIAAGDSAQCVIVTGAINAPCIVTQLDFVPGASLPAEPSQYMECELVEEDGVGGAPTSLQTFDNATGDWESGKIAFTWTASPGYQLAAGHSIAARWSPISGGVPIPGGAWRIT